MIYWYTGQPGHGKTLHAIERLLKFKDEGRIVYACNIREFDYQKAGVNEMTPEQFRQWPEFLPDGVVALVDEAYEHGMLPKRPPGAKVPHHVEQLAKHRHRGLDFIFVSQSPDKQCDSFVQDLIERHIHVRRKFGTKIVQLREFDRFEAKAERATPLVTHTHKLPTRPMGLYKSTELDTTERTVPWYFYALAAMIPLGLALFWYTFSGLGKRLSGSAAPPTTQTAPTGEHGVPNGAPATVGATGAQSVESYLDNWRPRIPAQPWTAPAYDAALSIPNDPPRLYCVAASPGATVDGHARNSSCTCLTEQGTRYLVDLATCTMIARHGQYEPFRRMREAENRTGLDALTVQSHHIDRLQSGQVAAAVQGGTVGYGQMAQYGNIGVGPSTKN